MFIQTFQVQFWIGCASVTNSFLQKYNLFSFQHRLFVRFCTFSWRIFNVISSPIELSKQIKPTTPSTVLDESVVSNTVPVNNMICLRDKKINNEIKKRTVSKVEVSKLKYGELTFGKFFNKFINNCIGTSNYRLDRTDFWSLITKESSLKLFDQFIKNFLRFDLIIKNFNYKGNIKWF